MKKKILILSVATLSMVGLISEGHAKTNDDTENYVQAKEATETIETPAEVTQDEIKNKMINSIDYFDSAQGEFTYTSKSAEFDYTVSYEVSNVEGAHASHILTTNNITGDVQETYYDETSTTSNDSSDDIAKELYTFESRKTTAPDGLPVTYYREDPMHMGMASNSLLPEEIAFSYLEENELWSITGYEDYLGRDVVTLEGVSGEYISEKSQSEAFKMWVDTETGILLKFESYNETGEVMDKLETTSFTLNDSSINELDYSS